MIRLLVTDVDGTLVKESSNTLNPAYFDTIRALKEKGIQVVFASGRPYSSIHALVKPVEDLVWYIADGGVHMKTTGALKNISCFPEEWARELWSDISKIPNADGVISGMETVYIPKKDSFMCKIIRDDYKMNVTYQNGWEDFPTEPTGNISLFSEKDVETYFKEYIQPKWKDKLHLVIAGEWWLDCLMPGVNKGAALQKIMDEFGYTAEEILATGDNMNDLELISLAGTGLAVSSARREVKAVADGVIENYETDGVLKEWQKYL